MCFCEPWNYTLNIESVGVCLNCVYTTVCLFVCQSFALFSLFRSAITLCIYMKVYIERNNWQVELIPYHNFFYFFTFTFAKPIVEFNTTSPTYGIIPQIRKCRTQTTSAPYLTVYAD